MVNSTCDNTTRYPMEHNHQRRRELLHLSRPQYLRTKKSRRSLEKNPSRGLNAPFCFDILVQLVNILTRITLHELLYLSKRTKEALRDALADSELFLTQVPTPIKEDGVSCPQCHLVQQQVPCITFTPKDMLLKDNRHDRLLYYTGYIGSTYIERIQVDLGSALSIIPKRLLYFIGILLSRLSTMTTTIYGFNAGSSHHLGKIHLLCQIDDLKSEVTC